MRNRTWTVAWHVTRRYGTSRALRAAAAPLALVVTLLALAFVTLNAATLSSAQRVEGSLGRFDSAIGLTSVAVQTNDAAVGAAPTAAVRSAGGSDVTLAVESRDVRLDTASAPAVRYLELPNPGDNFPHRYRLVAGNWPTVAGDVAVTRAVRALAPGTRLAVLSGAAHWHVVGTVLDEYAQNTSLVVAGVGTWKDLPWSSLVVRQPNLVGSLTLYSNGTHVAQAQQALSQLAAARSDGASPAEVLGQLRQETVTRRGLLTASTEPGYRRYPLAFTVPALLFVPLSVLVAFGLPWRRTTRQLGLLRAIGLRRRDALMSVCLATAGLLILAMASGLLLGWGLGAVARPALLRSLGQPLSPLGSPSPLLAWVAGLVAASTLVMILTLTLSLAGVTTRALRFATPRPGRFRHVRRVAALGAFAGLIVTTQKAVTVDDVLGLVLLATICVSLVVPTLLASALGRLPARSVMTRLVREGLRRDRTRVVTTLLLVAATAGPLLSIQVINQSLTSTETRRAVSLVPPGAVLLTTSSTRALPIAVVRVTEDALDTTRPAISVSSIGGAQGNLSLEPSGLGLVVAVPSISDLEAVNGNPLPSRARAVLAAGGVLVWGAASTDRDTSRRLYLQPANGTGPPTTYQLPARTTPLNRFWGQQWRAVLLDKTAAHLGLPINKDSVVLSGLSDAQVARAKPALIARGYTTSYAQVYKVPFTFGLSYAEKSTSLGLALLLIAALASLGRNQFHALRGYATLLMALGLRRRWIGQVLLLRILLVVGCGLLAACLMTGIPITVLVLTQPGLVLDIPWMSVLEVLGTAVLACGGFACIGVQRLRATAYQTA